MSYRTLGIAATGMTAQQQNVDVIANNLANVNTIGFKRSRANFHDLLYQKLREAGFTAGGEQQYAVPLQIGTGVELSSTDKIFMQGSLDLTEGEKLNMAIEGEGFFQVELPDGQIAYTRAGALSRDRDGNLSMRGTGYFLYPRITIPPEADTNWLHVSRDGWVEYIRPGETTVTRIGRIELAMFPNPAGLDAIGENLYRETAASGTPTVGPPIETPGMGAIVHQALELSNVNVIMELVNLIKAQRAFEINGRAIQAADDMYQTVNNLRR